MAAAALAMKASKVPLRIISRRSSRPRCSSTSTFAA
eukprot:gene22215-16650_t